MCERERISRRTFHPEAVAAEDGQDGDDDDKRSHCYDNKEPPPLVEWVHLLRLDRLAQASRVVQTDLEPVVALGPRIVISGYQQLPRITTLIAYNKLPVYRNQIHSVHQCRQ